MVYSGYIVEITQLAFQSQNNPAAARLKDSQLQSKHLNREDAAIAEFQHQNVFLSVLCDSAAPLMALCCSQGFGFQLV